MNTGYMLQGSFGRRRPAFDDGPVGYRVSFFDGESVHEYRAGAYGFETTYALYLSLKERYGDDRAWLEAQYA